MFGIMEYVSAGLALLLIGTGVYNKIEVSELENDIAKSEVSLAQCQYQSSVYKFALESQTDKIEALRIDYNASVTELEEWKSKPPKVRYETIYQLIPKIEYIKGDCNDTKMLINSISTIKYNDL